jgi:hypothetical protein
MAIAATSMIPRGTRCQTIATDEVGEEVNQATCPSPHSVLTDGKMVGGSISNFFTDTRRGFTQWRYAEVELMNALNATYPVQQTLLTGPFTTPYFYPRAFPLPFP